MALTVLADSKDPVAAQASKVLDAVPATAMPPATEAEAARCQVHESGRSEGQKSEAEKVPGVERTEWAPVNQELPADVFELDENIRESIGKLEGRSGQTSSASTASTTGCMSTSSTACTESVTDSRLVLDV